MATSEMGVPDKMTVFQKCVGSFSRTNISADEARNLLTQLVHLFYVGESFQEAEATQLFFTITRLFQKDSPGLKQLIYLAIKELAPLTDNVIMGTSVLMRDVQQAQSSPQAFLFRPEALRALCAILDAGAVEGMDRLMRSAIVDRDENMASAGLVSAYHLLAIARDSVRRWATEIQESCISQRGVGQYHALGLLIEVRGHDTMALLKLAVSLAEQNVLLCPNAMALHVRLTGSLLAEQPRNPALVQILKGYCFNRSDIVALESAKTILNLVSSGAFANDELVSAAIGVLRAYLESPRATSRFAAIRALSKYAEQAPGAIASCNDEMESLVADANQTIATYAITTLLRTGSESNMNSLIDRVGTIVADKTTSDDFRLVVVDAVRSLAKRFPAKHDLMLDFFAGLLQHPGNVDLKLATVEAISDVLHTDSDSKSLNNAITMLGETIEDSEYPELIIRVLYLLGQIGPQADQPSQCVRVIYNRIILENSTVRAAAVSALAKFVDVVPGAQQLVERSQLDKNDEVRDRASLALISTVSTLPSEKLAVDQLETQLLHYLSGDDFQSEFTPSKVKVVSDAERFQKRIALETEAVTGEEVPEAPKTTGKDYTAELAEIPELSSLGTLLHTGGDQKLTDDDMEYVVKARVHVFPAHFVLQYEIQNNYELELSNVGIEYQIEPELEEDGVEPQLSISLPSLAPTTSGSTYLVFKHSGSPTYGFVSSTLTFTANEGDEDQYPLDELEIRPAEFIKPQALSANDHAQQWAQISGGETEQKATHQFKSSATLVEALEHLQSRLGLANSSGFTPLESDTTATVLLSGLSALHDDAVLVKAQLVKSSRSGLAGKLLVRSNDEQLARIVADGA